MAAAITPIGEQSASVQETPADTIIFKTHIENKEYQVWLDIDLYKPSILIPNQEVFGKVPGYLGAKRDTRKWIIVDYSISGNTAKLTIINDYGSEDLEASLTYNGDGTYTFKQIKGSTIEIVVNNKWVKLPQKMIFKK
ncbi:hypothetical protein [Prevotella pallens]|jgi:hypothetical protein|nr:hypothetical protein [Prevotella pallens]